MAPNRIAPDAGHRDEGPQIPTDLASSGGSRPEAVGPGPEPAGVASPDEKLAGFLRDGMPALFLWASTNKAATTVPERSYRIYRDQLLADCGSPTDPIEVMIIEQLALAHFNLGLLMCRAANAGQVQATSVYAGVAARLMAEFRRSSLALQAYRAASRQLAAAPTKDALILPDVPAVPGDAPGKRTCADELGVLPEERGDEGVIPFPHAASG